ncbi:MAG: hypothetical protein M3421_01395 [Bacteroidota bacterium]|nr:hypothetical protein [Bacteroidota bacterium]
MAKWIGRSEIKVMNNDLTEKHVFPSPIKYVPEVQSKRIISNFQKIALILGWLSLDVVLGSIVCNVMVFHLLKISTIPWIQVSLLGSTVWLIYILDHLWDAKKIQTPQISLRRKFFYQYYDRIKVLAYILFFLIAIFSFLLLPAIIFYFGLLLASFVSIYLLIVHYFEVKNFQRWFHKEIFVSLLYGMGIWGSAAIISPKVEFEHGFLGLIFIFIALQNLIIFSYYEKEEDILQNQISIVQVIGKKAITLGVIILLVMIFILGIITLKISNDALVHHWVLIEWAMALILFCLLIFTAFFKKHAAYRWIGDGVFILPAILWIL